MKIKKIHYNWFYTSGADEGEGYEIAEVGKHGCTLIEGHIPQGEGDKHYFDIWSEDQTMLRIFNPNMVFYEHPHVKGTY